MPVLSDEARLDFFDQAVQGDSAIMPKLENDQKRRIEEDLENGEAISRTNEALEGVESTAKRSSFDLISLQNRLHDFDEKYRRDGRYATSFPETVRGSRPTEPKSMAPVELPKIGPLLISTENSSDNTDDEISNAESTYNYTIRCY